MKPKKFRGTVTQYNKDSGHGLITTSDNPSNMNKDDISFHISDLDADSVSEGDELKFSIRKTDEGFEARKPIKIDTENGGKKSQRPTTTPGNRNTTSGAKNTVEMKGCEGTVTTYFNEDGYGFVSTADILHEYNENESNTTDVFFHTSDLDTNTVSEGDRLKFGIVETNEGLQATRPKIVEREDRGKRTENVRKDPAERLGVSGSKDDTKYGRENPTTSGDIESFDDENKFR